MLGASQCLASTAFAQNEGIGGLSQAFGEANQDGTAPWYRVEVLAFAYNGFDSDEEIFPDEPLDIRLDTRPPNWLVRPAPRPAGLLADIAQGGEEFDPENRPEAAPVDESPLVASETGFLANAATDGPESEPAPSDQPLGPADDGTLESLLRALTTPDPLETRTQEPDRIRSAYGQRLIASLETLDDPSRVPLLSDLTLEDSPLSGPAMPDGGGGDANRSVPATEPPQPTFRVLRADELRLGGSRQRLLRDGDYRPLAHGGWVQPALPPERAIPINLALLGVVNPTGAVRLHLSRFLHINANIAYRAPLAPPSPPSATPGEGALSELILPQRYALRAQRRVRSGEVHYLDHPAFGLLVLVTPQPVPPPSADDGLARISHQGPRTRRVCSNTLPCSGTSGNCVSRPAVQSGA